MNSGHVITEAYRMGLHGPYLMPFSRSGIPAVKYIDMTWSSELGIRGYIATSGRGYVGGTASGIASSFQKVVHWYNSAAQYWTYASANEASTSPAKKPGTFTMVLYQVAQTSVSVSAGPTTTMNIASTSHSMKHTLENQRVRRPTDWVPKCGQFSENASV
jgi:rhamnogalacturonan endolyase